MSVTVKPEPVGVAQTPIVCSDVVLGVGATLTTNGTSVSAASYTINSITFSPATPLTASAGTPVTGSNKAATELIDDSWTNKTAGNVNVIYTVTPISSAGCSGSSFTVTVTVQPEPVGANGTATVCSDVVTGYTLSGASSYNISVNSNGLVQSGGTSSGGTGKLATEIATDSWTNTNSVPASVDVVYTIVPVSALGCLGDPYTVTVSVKPEPRGFNDAKQICSTSGVGYTLQTSNINNGGSGGNSLASTFQWVAASNASVGGETSAGPVSSGTISDVLTNTTNLDQVVVYTVTPTGVNGCLGDTFTVSVTVKPEPVGVAQTQTTCSDVMANYNLINNVALLGNNIGSTFTWIAISNSNVTGESTSSQSGSIITDNLNNVTSIDQTVVYNATPTGVNGCVGSVFQVSIKVKPEPVGTTLSAPTICSGSSVNYSLQGNINLVNSLASTFTWIASSNTNISGASTTSAQTTSTITDVLVNTSFIPQSIDYTINPTGMDGCSGDVFVVTVTVNPKVQISAGPDLALCSDNPTIQLQGLVIYAPNGVVWTGGTGIYSANTNPTSNYNFNNPLEINQTLVLTLTGNDPDGLGPCVAEFDKMNLKINPLPVVVFSGLPPGSPPNMAENQPPITLTGNQIGGVFTISPATSNIGSTSPSPVDKASFDPGAVTLGINTIIYTYTDGNGCINKDSQNVIVNPITNARFSIQYAFFNSLTLEHELCPNQGDVLLTGSPNFNMDGPNQFISLTSGLTIIQSGAPGSYIHKIPTDGLASGTYFINYKYTNALGAVSDNVYGVKVYSAAQPTISAASNCIAAAIPLSGSATIPPSPFPSTVTSWSWNFADGSFDNSGPNVSHVYNAANIYNVVLTVGTSQGCSSSVTKQVRVGDVPIANYDWAAICTNDQTIFKDLTKPGSVSTIINYTWNFGDGEIISGAPSASVSTGSSSGIYKNPTHKYAVPGSKTVKLTVDTNDGCNNSISQQVTILIAGTSVTPNLATPYFNTFDIADLDWFTESKVLSAPGILPVVYGSNSWLRGTPAGSDIKTASSGSTAWWTGSKVLSDKSGAIPNPTYFDNEASWVNGPCFDLTQLERPMISLDYFADAETNVDGAVIQYSTNGGLNWFLVGPLAGLPPSQRDQGINWYDPNTNILSNPGQQLIGPYGWTGKSGQWKNARFNLDMVAPIDRDQVRVRIAFSSNLGNAPGNNYDGFGFDNFFIGEKKRTVLVEHFTNSSLSGSTAADLYLNGLYTNEINLRGVNKSDFNDIQYHISYASSTSDLLNLDNPNDPNARASSYGVSQPPKSFMDGVKNAKFNGTTINLNNIEIDRRALQDPKFVLKLDTIATGKSNTINVKLTMTALENVSVPLIAQVALVEDNVVTTSGTFKNVLRKLLFGSDLTKPDGITINTPFIKGDVASRPNPNQEIEINVPIKNGANLSLVGFIQDKNTGEIYQSTILKSPIKKGTTIVGIEEPPVVVNSISEVQIYPNPASGKFNFAVPGSFPSGNVWKIADQRGIFIMKGDFTTAVNGIQQVDISTLANGVYFVLIGAEGQVPTYKKLVVVNQN